MERAFFAHETALVESDQIGPGTRIWAFAHVMKGARIGADCNIGDHCFVESDVVIGDQVVVKNGVSIWKRVRIGDRVFIGPNAVFINDRYPRSKLYRDEYVSTLVKKGASIGANATILCGLTIGEYAMIGAGAVVTQDVPAFALVYGNPARVQGYVCTCSMKLDIQTHPIYCACGAVYVYEDGYGVRAVEGANAE